MKQIKNAFKFWIAFLGKHTIKAFSIYARFFCDCRHSTMSQSNISQRQKKYFLVPVLDSSIKIFGGFTGVF